MKAWFFSRRKRDEKIVIVDPKREAEVIEMRARQADLQDRLGISQLDDVQAWLRLHEILHEHERRLAALEALR